MGKPHRLAWIATQPFAASTTSPSFVSYVNLLSMHFVGVSRSLMKIVLINQLKRVDPWGISVVTLFQLDLLSLSTTL